MDARTSKKETPALAAGRAERSDQMRTAEAARYLNVSVPTLWRLWARQEIKRTGTGKMTRWPRRELDRWIEKNTRAKR